VLKPTGLFYMGVYGGREFEGIWQEDFYTPKRFFSFYLDHRIQEVVSEFFEILYFNSDNLRRRKSSFSIYDFKEKTMSEMCLTKITIIS
jgi:hypothetical protein